MLRTLVVTLIGVIVLTSQLRTSSANIGHPLPPPRPVACITCRIIDLSAVVGGGAIDFIPTAINNAGQIVGYDGGSGVNGVIGTAYLINPNLSFVSFGQGFTFNVPTAISNFGKSIVGNFTYTDQFGQESEGISAWRLASPTNVTLNYSNYGAGETFEIASNNVPVGDDAFYGFPSYSFTKFPSSGCTITDFLARAINDQGTIVGSGGGYAAYGSTTACAKPIALPRPTNGSTEAHGINSQGDLLVSFTGPAAPAFGAEYLVKGGRLVRIALPSTYSSNSVYLVARAISDRDEVVGDILTQTPPFAGVAPFIYQNGLSTDLNSLLPRNSGWKLLTAAGITVGGEVIGTGFRNGVLRGYALQP